MHHKDDSPFSPDAKHGGVNYVGQRTLWIISDSFAQHAWIITSSKEPSLAPCERNQKSKSSKLIISPSLPVEVRRKGSEILWLEILDDVEGELGLAGEGGWLTTVV